MKKVPSHKGLAGWIFLCSKCDKTFKSSIRATAHAKNCGIKTFRKRQKSIRKMSCNFCGHEENTVAALTRHRLRHHGALLSNHRCSRCQKHFVSMKSYTRHVARHGSSKVFTCTFEGCGLTYKTKANMIRHKKDKHLGRSFPSMAGITPLPESVISTGSSRTAPSPSLPPPLPSIEMEASCNNGLSEIEGDVHLSMAGITPLPESVISTGSSRTAPSPSSPPPLPSNELEASCNNGLSGIGGDVCLSIAPLPESVISTGSSRTAQSPSPSIYRDSQNRSCSSGLSEMEEIHNQNVRENAEGFLTLCSEFGDTGKVIRFNSAVFEGRIISTNRSTAWKPPRTTLPKPSSANQTLEQSTPSPPSPTPHGPSSPSPAHWPSPSASPTEPPSSNSASPDHYASTSQSPFLDGGSLTVTSPSLSSAPSNPSSFVDGGSLRGNPSTGLNPVSPIPTQSSEMTAGLEEMDLGPEWVDVVDMATQTISKFNCGICDRNYRDSHDLQRHVKSMHKTRYHTQDSVTFSWAVQAHFENTFLSHKTTLTSLIFRLDSKGLQVKFACRRARCKRVFNTQGGLKQHTAKGCFWRCPVPNCTRKPLSKESLENVQFTQPRQKVAKLFFNLPSVFP